MHNFVFKVLSKAQHKGRGQRKQKKSGGQGEILLYLQARCICHLVKSDILVFVVDTYFVTLLSDAVSISNEVYIDTASQTQRGFLRLRRVVMLSVKDFVIAGMVAWCTRAYTDARILILQKSTQLAKYVWSPFVVVEQGSQYTSHGPFYPDHPGLALSIGLALVEP